ncbi:cell division protein FtsQ/DivIB [Aquisalimonas lutea]|uniref:cell division protein FtsQ/DivIB n=1 Tax=Aquisalimonas lutea TaxID=1327750 RepID=UPI0025B50B25|nr:cell division protein FtsQ/DivIB [Aquisalimonas lutea]MDN3517418.1 cell division protein FtsQ/DivIB [Aquisalimonas lutea]
MKREREQRGARRRRQGTDPAERSARRARVGRWLLRFAGGAGAAATLAGAVWGVAWVLAPDTFPLESVHFDSRLEHVREGDLRDALEGHLDDGFWGLDVTAIRGALEGLPWVETAAVRRVWPGQLRVKIREQEAVAVWNDEALLGAGGDVFAAQRATWPSGLPELGGPQGRHDEVRDRYRQLQRALEPIGFGVTGLRMDARESWTAELDTGARLRLGQDNLQQRMERFVTAYPQVAREREAGLARADLRYPNGFSVRWRDQQDDAPN